MKALFDAEQFPIGDGIGTFVAAFRAMQTPIVITNPREYDNPIVFVNEAFCRLSGYTCNELVGRNCRFMQGEGRDAATIARIRDALETATPIEIDIRNYRKDGSAFWNRLLIAPLRDADGSVAYFISLQRDVTVENETIGAGRVSFEETLQHSQELDAVGQLTGGIAHNFNNLLQAIGGNLDLARRRIEQGRSTETVCYLDNARQTLDDAAELTTRLLEIARRQPLHPTAIVLPTLVEGMADLLRRRAGPAIEVRMEMKRGEGTVFCDPNQLQAALLNVASNACNAMPHGGRLTISVEYVQLQESDLADQEGIEPGLYLMLIVSDTGVGMNCTIARRAFEPFFTTRPLGQGRGLGLAQVYGFIRQSNGFLRIESEPGYGTTLRLHLPAYDAAIRQVPDAASAPGKDAGNGEPADEAAVVLVVEDEAGVRSLIAEWLRYEGHTVLEAADGHDALQALETARRVDMLVTDVGLPGGLDGRHVADTARLQRPALPVLFITGYAGNRLNEHLEAGMQVLGKPFALDALSSRVMRLLEMSHAGKYAGP